MRTEYGDRMMRLVALAGIMVENCNPDDRDSISDAMREIIDNIDRDLSERIDDLITDARGAYEDRRVAMEQKQRLEQKAYDASFVVPKLEHQIADLENKVKYLSRFEPVLPETAFLPNDTVRKLIAEGSHQKIAAIKEYRQQIAYMTRKIGLREAKLIVDRLQEGKDVTVGDVRFHVIEGLVSRGGDSIELSSKPLSVLLA